MGERTLHTRRRQAHAMGASDVAQAALFADILSAEVVTLRAELRNAEKKCDAPAKVARLREQLKEAKRLSASLRKLPTNKV